MNKLVIVLFKRQIKKKALFSRKKFQVMILVTLLRGTAAWK
jgi:hypothetical protein